MRYGFYRQGYGKPSQGCQLRGSSPLSQGLISCVPFTDVSRALTTTLSQQTLYASAIDISGYHYQAQWSGLNPGVSGPDRAMSPWGDAGRFHDQTIWINYFPNQAYLDNFPSGAAPRTLSALINLPPWTNPGVFQMVADYGPSPNFGGFNGSRFTLGYLGELNPPMAGLHCDNATNLAIFVPDGDWHLLSVVFPVGGATVADALVYIDGRAMPTAVVNGSVAVNTQVLPNDPGQCYSIGQENAALEQGTALYGVQGLIAGVWLWNRALSATEQALHWQDPYHMLARPRSLSPAIVLAPPPPTPPTCSISSAPNVITPGSSSTLVWTTTNTPLTASIDNGIGSVDPTGGSVSVSPLSTTTYTLTVTNADGTSTCAATVIVQAVPGPLAGQCNNPPVGKVGVPYSVTFTAIGGVPPYTYAITSGALPFGLTLASNGVVSGTPTTSGVYFFTVTSTDSNGLVSSFNCNIPIAC